MTAEENALRPTARVVRNSLAGAPVKVKVDGVTYALKVEVIAYDGCRPSVIDPHAWCGGCGYVFACSPTCGWVGVTRAGFVNEWRSHAFDCPRR